MNCSVCDDAHAIVPSWGFRTPLRIWASVDFPDPLDPIMVISDRFGTEIETLFRALEVALGYS